MIWIGIAVVTAVAFGLGYHLASAGREADKEHIASLTEQRAVDADKIAALTERIAKSGSALKQSVAENTPKNKTILER